MHAFRTLSTLLFVLAVWSFTSTGVAQTRIRNICHVKGQEESVLVGMGLVVGLNGTGDGNDHMPAIRSLAAALESLGLPLGPDGLKELDDNKNVALVMVEAKVPRQGAPEGVKLDCTVSSTGAAKSLEGGRLFLTPLVGPLPGGEPGKRTVYAVARGPIQVDSKVATIGRIHDGCQLVEDFINPYVKDDAVTLVLDKYHAGWEVAQEVTNTVNRLLASLLSEQRRDERRYPDARRPRPNDRTARYNARRTNASQYNTAQFKAPQYKTPDWSQSLAYPPNQNSVVIPIPPQYRNLPVEFISLIMREPLDNLKIDARVVVNERTGTIIISGDVTIGAVIVSHENIVVDAGGATNDRFVPFDPSGTADTVRLQALVDALKAIKLPGKDIIEIIKDLQKNGNLHATLITE